MKRIYIIYSIVLLLSGVVQVTKAQSSPEPKSAIQIRGNVYGGGEMAKVAGNTNVIINAGQLAGSIFGGGEGALYTEAGGGHEIGDVKASADISGSTSVSINDGEIVYTVGDENNLRNIYGGGNLACNVTGNTNVEMTKGIITTYSFVSDTRAMAAWRYFYDNSMKPNQQKTPICSVFGAGYGAHTDVAGNTNVDINIPGTAGIQPADGKDFTHEELETIDHLGLRLKPDTKLSEQFVPSVFGGGFDGTVGAYDAAANAGAGGINYDKTTYTSQANITIKGQPFVFNVYGGGLGSKSGADATGGVNSHVGAIYGATKVDIQGGLYNGNLFGGGAGIEAEDEIDSPFGAGKVMMPYTYAAQVMRETDVAISGNTTVIFGNVYGGGDIANTGWYYESARPKMDGHVAQKNKSLATLDYTTSLKLNGGNILGSVFGGGNGRTKAQMTMSMFVGTVCGSTNVELNGTKVWSHVYGGGNMGTVFTCQTIAASKSESGRAMATGVIDGCTNVAVLKGMVAKDIFGGGYGDDPGTGVVADVTSADIYGNTYVYFENADLEYSKYWKPREFLPSTATDVEMANEVTGKFLDQSSAGPKRNTESDITHNLYGGGNMACDVKGNAHVYMVGAPIAPAHFATTDYYKECIENVAKPHFSVFGGGFGDKAIITGNTYADINLRYGTGLHSIVGGGLNGTVDGMCNVHVGNDPMSLAHFVYGGGYYAPCAGTKLDITRGTILENVYGGAVMGNIHAAGATTEVATNTTIGLKSEGDGSSVILKDEFDKTLRSYTYDDHKNQITIGGDVYGGNDVSGTVNGIAQLTIYGGEIKGNVYGAGNGNHIGYYIPGALKYDLGTHGDENYFMVDHSGEGGPKGKTYVGRPQTIGGVNLTLEGNKKEERVKVLGQVFGGGNSCTIGAWNKSLMTTTYEGNPHLVRDDPEYFQGGGSLNINLGSHVTIGRTHEQLAKDTDGSKYIDNDENVSGLFMGCSGKDLATQSGAMTENHYHHFFSPYAKHYYPGFVVYDEHGDAMSRAEQLKPFQAYLNNIMVWSDNVHLNIPDNADDIWLANFVGGGFRGSMRAKTLENGRFDYTLPEGVTVSHTVVGGAYNAHVQYRVFATNNDGTFIDADDDGKYDYLTVVPGGWTQMDPDNPTAECDYIKTLHEDEDDPEKVTGILRYNFNGGILSINSTGVSSSEEGRHIHQVHADPRANEAEYATSYFEPMTEGSTDPNSEDEETRAKLYSANKSKTLLHLTLKCALEPEVLPKDDSGNGRATEYKAHGGNVFGGCFLSGFVEGDSWVDYHCWLAPKCANSTDDKYKYFFNKNDNMHIYDDAGDLETNDALSVYGAGYGTDTHSDGDVYLYIKSIAHHATGDADPAGMFPYIFNAFGGSNMGTVSGNTNVYYAVGLQGTLLGSLYGGGYKGVIEGNTFVEMAEGFAHNVYGGSRQADIHGAAHVWAYDGKARGIKDANHLIICNLYGGNDIAGTISGTMPAKFTESKWGTAPTGETLTGKQFNTYVEISADDDSADRGFPMIGSAYAGGNGEAWVSEEESGNKPDVAKALLEVEGGTTLRAFGGGNKATITEDTYIFTNAESNKFANVTFNDYQKNIVTKVFFNGMSTGYKWEDNTLKIDPYHVVNLFGGNNVATMTIQPTWNLWKGKLENVYSGGNMGDMTYYNPSPATGKTKGLCLTIDSDNISIESLYGGCRMSDVKAMNGDTPITLGENDYGATVNVIKGHIGNVYGGNDISGFVYNGTNVNLSGSITGNVYGAGNGNYLYAYDKTSDQKHVGTKSIEEEWSSEYNQNVYWIPGSSTATPLQQLLALNKIRPHVSKAYLNIQGTSDNVGEKVYIYGSVYCGGNASTIRPMTDDSGDDDAHAHVKFNIGNDVIVNKVFMGSNGESLKYDANGTSNYLVNFEKLNGLNLATDLTDSDWNELNEGNVSNADKELLSMSSDLRDQLYPNLLSVYMRAVDMKAMPQGFDMADKDFTNTWIGTFCMGGNAGSMMVDKPVDIVFPQSLNFFGRIIGGSMDASFQYKGKWHRGGFRMPLAAGAQLKDDNGDLQPTKTKLRMKIRGDWYSRRMVMEEQYKTVGDYAPAGDYLVYDKTNDGVNWDRAGKAWHDGCNVYGGCYQSGDMVGDVQIYIESDMLAYSDPRYGTTIDAYTNQELDKSNELNLPVANVYGAGYGPESRSFGDAYIYMKDIPNVAAHHPSVNNIFGGGRNGMLVGNSVIHVHDGLVYKDVVGGSFAAPMYGSAQVTVGYPKFYVCKKSGEYFIDRADKWNEGYMTKGNNKTESVIKKSIKYFEGTYVPCNVYDQITGVKLHGSEIITPLSSIHTATRQDNDYFAFHDESADASLFPTGGWNSVEIRVRGGVYGGGFSLSNSTAAIAGSYTTMASTEEYNHGVDSQGNSSQGYGGNSSIIISDFVGELADGQDAKDHIKISTETTQKDGEGNVVGEYKGIGGIYGDGRLVFCEGFRAAELNGYGYAGTTPSDPLMLNSLQRLDLLTVNDCCFKLYGDEDFATDEINKRKYSLARIGELRMNSTIDATGTYATVFTTRQSRNYIGFYNTIHYIGAIVSNDDFRTDKFHDATGVVDNANTYRSKKQWYIDKYHGKTDEESINAFKQRNYATARNMIGINSGFSLHVENLYYEGDEHKTYNGPIVGVAEVKLLNVQPGEGGGYVYADNVHADTYDKSDPKTATFMNESGNFVFEGVIRPGEDAKQYIVDDCLPKGFDECGGNLPEQHYWYVIGDTYYYHATLTAFSFKTKKEFDLSTADPNVIFAGIEKDWEVSLQSVKWLMTETPDASGNYSRDIRGGRDNALTPLAGSDKKYEFTLQVGDNSNSQPLWSNDMPRSTTDAEQIALPTWTTYNNTNTTPRFNVHLIDNVNNCPPNEEEEYYNAHLSEPENVQLIIQARKQDGTTVGGDPAYETKTYNVTLEIVYIQGPSFTGNVNIMNCALPGERIGFDSKEIQIKTTDQLPVTGFDWKLVPLKSETFNDETHKMEYSWDDKNATVIPASYYYTTAEGYSQGSVPALYSQNHWNVCYVFRAGGEDFVVAPATDEEKKLYERMLVVHNYHKMADIVDTKYDVTLATGENIYAKALKSGSMVYLADDADIAAFVSYVNDGNNGEGLNFYLQNDLTLPAAITKAFAGTLHGNGYSLTLPSADGTLFGNNLTGKFYNLGVPNGTIASTGTIVNCFDATDNRDALCYGKKAYNLSHYYTTDNDATERDNYVNSLYGNNDGMGGDWRYARIADIYENARFLRTGAPNYGNMQTNHNTGHAGDYTLTEHDCLFFGQTLNPTGIANRPYPEHIDEAYSVNKWVETNRVYRTAGYYGSSVNDGFHYNKVAWAMQPTLTAIDYTAENPDSSEPSSFYGKTDDRLSASELTSFSSDHNGTVTPYSNETNSKASQNLLVYNAGESVFAYSDTDNCDEAEVEYHNIANGCTDYLHLVDKQDFNAPIAFNVTQRAWYERMPQSYRNVTTYGYESGSAWEGIVLPFTTTKVTAEKNGEISHFYGDSKLHHEYWLRGLKDVVDSKATFASPAVSGDAYFTDSHQAGTSYVYPKNDYFTSLFNYGNHYNSRDEDGDKTFNDSDEEWYANSHTFENYVPLTADVPYIVAFPGDDFYEFSMESYYNDKDASKYGSTPFKQKATFESGATTIGVSDGKAVSTTASSYTHHGTFLHKSSQLGVNSDGTAFVAEQAIVPFRTYMTSTTSPAKTRCVYICGSEDMIDVDENRTIEEDRTDKMLRLYLKQGSVIVESNYETDLPVYTVAGQYVRTLHVNEGENEYKDFLSGVYIIGKKKVLISSY
ncbi:MAG: hypothetical protein MJZ36_00080 [Bacteroidaceae bacterium]|nr:hypothetical protein [Bacteroidaceae bacterium]